jgi:predicted DNA-binding transcriptional regulator YafY
MSRIARKGKPAVKFSQHRKIDRLREALSARASGLTLAELSMVLRSSERTVRRYLLELSRDLELESIALEPGGAHVWRIKASERGRAVVLRRSQAQAFLATRAQFEIFRGSALFDEFDAAFKDLHRVAERPVRTQRGEVAADAKLERRFFFASGPTRNFSARGDDIDSIFMAVAQSRVISFVPLGKKERTFMVPHALVAQNGTLAVFSLEGARPWSVTLEEMGPVTVEATQFKSPEDLDPSRWLTPLGLEREGEKPERIVLEFDASLSALSKVIRVHPSQKIAFAADGRFRLAISTTLVEPVLTWVLSMLPHVTVVEPKSLVQAVSQRLERSLALHLAKK